jgi:hypothetical protein
MKRANVILTPRQRNVINFKLKQAKKKRLIKKIIYNNDLSPDTKIGMVRNIIL